MRREDYVNGPVTLELKGAGPIRQDVQWLGLTVIAIDYERGSITIGLPPGRDTRRRR